MKPFSIEHVKQALTEHSVNTKIQTFEESTRTAQEAADAVGTELGSIVKSLCFKVKDSPVIVLAAGNQRVDDRKLAQIFEVGRKKVRIASAEMTIEYSGYAPGGVAPVGHRKDMPILIDETLERFETVYAAAGTANTIFPISFEQLVEITNGQVSDIVTK